MKSNNNEAYNKILTIMTHASFVFFIIGYGMGLIGLLLNDYMELVYEDAIILSIFVITYICYILKKISIEFSMKVLSFLAVADMIYPDILFPAQIKYHYSSELSILKYIFLVFVIPFTTSKIYAIALNIFIIIALVLTAFLSGNNVFIESLPIVILCLMGMGVFSIVFDQLIKKLLNQADESRDRIKDLSNYKQNIIRLIIHDLKVPINTIFNISSNMENEKMKSINKHVEVINKQLENVLDIERLEEPKISLNVEKVDVREIIDNAIKAVAIFAQNKNVSIQVEYSKNCKLICDIDLIERTIINLLTNALKYTSINKEIAITVDIENNKCKISIKDNGEGIAEEHLEKIFEKFYVLKRKKTMSSSSTGLGLSFCKLAIEAHRGEITVKSELGKGSVFEIYLPDFKFLDSLEENSKLIKRNFKFTDDEEKMLKQICIRLKNIPIYKVSEIIKLTENVIENNSKDIILWKNYLVDAVYSSNQELFDEMIESYIETASRKN